MMINIFGVATEHIEELWDILEPFIQLSIDKGTPIPEESTEDVKRELLDKSLSLWVAVDSEDGEIIAAMTTYIAEMPLVKRAVIRHLAGIEMKSWFEFYPLVEEWAREHGATEMVVKGRPGWARVLQAQGYTPQYVALVKQL